jgi:hypothetical protein
MCHFCGKYHTFKNCPLENEMALFFKKKVGSLMEYYIANNFNCPCCNKKELSVINNNAPSLDIICKCGKKIEVKSKCLSVINLPNNIFLNHGSYIDYINRVKEEIDLFIVIYAVDRIKKIIKIREVLYITHNMLTEDSNINVIEQNNNRLSTIIIKDRTKLNSLPLPNCENTFDFNKDIEDFKDKKIDN